MESNLATASTFEELGIDSELCSIIKEMGWQSPTKIQREAIPLALDGKDILAIAETGLYSLLIC